MGYPGVGGEVSNCRVKVKKRGMGFNAAWSWNCPNLQLLFRSLIIAGGDPKSRRRAEGDNLVRSIPVLFPPPSYYLFNPHAPESGLRGG
jgi:hypothetical protein